MKKILTLTLSAEFEYGFGFERFTNRTTESGTKKVGIVIGIRLGYLLGSLLMVPYCFIFVWASFMGLHSWPQTER